MPELSTFSIRAKSERHAEIMIYGDIGASWDGESVTAAKFVRDLNALDADVIDARINSYGGSVSDALAIYNALVRHPATINTYVDGVAVSAASLIAMAGRTLVMAENAMLMIHGPMAMAAGNAQTMREMAAVLDKYAAAMAPSYAAKTKKPREEMLALLTDGEDHWFTAAEAQAAGFADEVSAPIQVDAAFDFRRFRGVPAALAAFQRSNIMPDKHTPTPAASAGAQPPNHEPAAPAPAAAPLAVVPPAGGRTIEHNREIRAAFEPFLARDGVRAVYDEIMLDPAISVDAARARLLTKLGEGTGPANPPAARVEMGASEADKFREAATIAIVARAGYATAQERATLGANPYRGHRLMDVARASLERIGYSTRGLSQMEIVAAAFTQSTSDFPVLLENTMHKALQAAYDTAPDTWSRFCARGSVSDFRAHKRYRVGSLSDLDDVNELGEFKSKAIPDGETASITATTKGNIINLSRQTIVNDDLGAFVGLAAALGRAGKRSVENSVYAMLGENSGAGPTLTDTGILFNTTAITSAGGHANRVAYAAPTVALIDGGRAAMAAQMDPSQNDYLDLRPKVWVGALSQGGTARVINGAVYDPDTANKLQRPNMVAGLFSDIVDSPRITWSGWYMFADPMIAPVIEVAFLDGNDSPFLEMQNGFDVDGARWKVRLDYGVAVIDYRGGYACVGS